MTTLATDRVFARRHRPPFGALAGRNWYICVAAIVLYSCAVSGWNIITWLWEGATAAADFNLYCSLVGGLILPAPIYLTWYFSRLGDETGGARAALAATVVNTCVLGYLVAAAWMVHVRGVIDSAELIVGAVLLVSGAAIISLGVHRKRRSERPWTASDSHFVCGVCGYDLEGVTCENDVDGALVGTCSECGRRNVLDWD